MLVKISILKIYAKIEIDMWSSNRINLFVNLSLTKKVKSCYVKCFRIKTRLLGIKMYFNKEKRDFSKVVTRQNNVAKDYTHCVYLFRGRPISTFIWKFTVLVLNSFCASFEWPHLFAGWEHFEDERKGKVENIYVLFLTRKQRAWIF